MKTTKIITYLGLAFIIIIMLFRYFTPLDRSYGFVYPSWWHKQIIDNGNYFNGLVLSINQVEDNEDSFENGGFVEVNLSNVDNKANNVKDYLDNLNKTENENIKAGKLPEIPGPSQYKYVGPTSFKGLEKISSLFTLNSGTQADEFWIISNNKLISIRVKYPAEYLKSKYFDLGTKLIFSTFKHY